jgi:hypothetical protein
LLRGRTPRSYHKCQILAVSTGRPALPASPSVSLGLEPGPASCDARILSEAFQLASAGGCATGLQTRSRHACDSIFRVLTTGSGSATAFDSAFAQSHGSRLFSLKLPFISQSSGVVFNIASLGSFSRNLPGFQCSPRCVRSLCPPFGVFRWAVSILHCSRQRRTHRADPQ